MDKDFWGGGQKPTILMNLDEHTDTCGFCCAEPLGDIFEIFRSDFCQNTYKFCSLDRKNKKIAIHYVHHMAKT